MWKYIVRVLTLPDLEPHPQWPDPIGKELFGAVRVGRVLGGRMSTERFMKLPRIWDGRGAAGGFVVATYQHECGNLYRCLGGQEYYGSNDEAWMAPDPFRVKYPDGVPLFFCKPEDIIDTRDYP